jgi:hypothetical protein
VIGWKCSCITRSELRGTSCEDWKSALRLCAHARASFSSVFKNVFVTLIVLTPCSHGPKENISNIQGCKLLSDIGQCNLAKVILIGHWSDHKKNCHIIHFLLWQNPIANSLNLHFAIKFTRHSSILLNVAPNGYTYLSRDLYIYISCDAAYVYVRPKLKVIGQMSCQVKYLFAALNILNKLRSVVNW